MKKAILVIVAVTVVLAVQVLATDGINLIGLGPVQQGTAGAGSASAKDSTWLITNPAGLVDLERRVDASAQLFMPVREIHSTMSGGAGKQEDDSFFVVPSISASLGCCASENGFLGIGFYGTSGMGVDYEWGRMGADTDNDGMPDTPQKMGDKKTELSIAKLTAVYARGLNDGWSVAAGPIMVVSRLRTDMFNGRGFESGDWDTALGVGAIIGVNKKIDKLALGLSYISQQYMQSFDEYKTLMPNSFDLPQQITTGAAYDVLPEVEVALDYQWINWSGVDELGDHFGWDDQHVIKAGVTWGVNDSLTLRGGISHASAPIDEDNAFSNALFPAIVETHIACGASYVLTDSVELHFAYVHAFEESVKANGADMTKAVGMPAGAGTEISMYQNSFTFGASYLF